MDVTILDQARIGSNRGIPRLSSGISLLYPEPRMKRTLHPWAPLGWLCILLMLASAHAARAGAIRLDFTASSQFSKGSVLLKMKMTNNGDESAHDVRVAVFFGDIHEESETLPLLSAGSDHEWTLDLGSPPKPAGIYIIVMRVHYTDIFGHPVSVLHTTEVFTSDVDPTPPFRADLGSTELRGPGKVPLTLTETSGRAYTVNCRLIVPDEIECEAAEVSLRLEPNGTAAHDFPVLNRMALRGSHYRIYAIMDFVRDGRHVSVQKPAFLTIDPHRIMSNRTRYGWIGLALVLLLAFVVAQRWPRERGSVAL